MGASCSGARPGLGHCLQHLLLCQPISSLSLPHRCLHCSLWLHSIHACIPQPLPPSSTRCAGRGCPLGTSAHYCTSLLKISINKPLVASPPGCHQLQTPTVQSLFLGSCSSTLSDVRSEFSMMMDLNSASCLAIPLSQVRRDNLIPGLLSSSQIRSSSELAHVRILNTSGVRLPWRGNPTCSVRAAIHCSRVEDALRSAPMA